MGDRGGTGVRGIPAGRDQLHNHADELPRAGHACFRRADRGMDDRGRQHPLHAVRRTAAGRRDHAHLRPDDRDRVLQSGHRRRPDPVAAPLLVLRAPGGLRRAAPGDGGRDRNHHDLRAQEGLRLPDRHLHGRGHGRPELLRVGAPPVHRGNRPANGEHLHHHHAIDLGPHCGVVLRLHCHAVWGIDHAQHAHAVGARLRGHVPDRGCDGDLPGRGGCRHLLPRHLLRARPLPLHVLPDCDHRGLCGHHLLVPEDVREDDGRPARQDPLLGDHHTLQHDLHPALRARDGRAAPQDLQLLALPRAGARLVPGHARARHGVAPGHARLPVRLLLQLVQDHAPRAEGAEESVEGELARVDHRVPPPHGNWRPDEMPVVYRGPYEYSTPDREDDYWPQNEPSPRGS